MCNAYGICEFNGCIKDENVIVSYFILFRSSKGCGYSVEPVPKSTTVCLIEQN